MTIRQARLAQIEARERWYEARANANVAKCSGKHETYMHALDDLSDAYREYKRAGEVVYHANKWF